MTIIDKGIGVMRRMSPAAVLVTINVAVFVALRLAAIVIRFGYSGISTDSLVSALVMPRSAEVWLQAPWTAITYMFVQYDPLHLLMNMLWLYMFGSILGGFVSARRVFALYVTGGLCGAAGYLIANSVPSSFSGTVGLTGASASILAIMSAAMILRPKMRLRLVLFGDASLKVVGLIAVLLVIITTGTGNYGTHAAHAGGFFAGVAFALLDSMVKKVPARSMAAGGVPGSEPCQDTLDELLDKIRRSGFSSLTPDERSRLISLSSNLQKRKQ